MQVHLRGSSPLISYSPCRDCPADQGWMSDADYEGDNTTIANGGDSTRTNGTDPGFVTAAKNATVALNFTGTGFLFDVAFAPKEAASGPGAGAGVSGSNADWTTTLRVNGSAPPPEATSVGQGSGVIGLPPGRHQFELQLSRNDGASKTWARVDGVQGTMAGLIQASTVNTTVDDTAWRNGTITLSQGWNMLDEVAGSNWINETQYQIELKSQGRQFNRSLSWTDQPGANTTIGFSGSAVWVMGLTGGEAGTFEVRLDNETQGVFNAAGGPRTFNATLWHISGIEDGPHTVSLINQAGRLSFDYLVATTGIGAADINDLTHNTLGTKTGTAATATATASSTASASGSAAAAAGDHKGTKTAVVVGASVGSILGLLLITLGAFFIWSRCRRRNRHSDHSWQEKKPWYHFNRDKGWRFENLEPHRQIAAHNSVWDRVSRTDTFKSTSSFGSSASQLHQPAPAHTRRSLLPLANNLWAKAKKSESPHPMTEVGSSLKPPSPDPMAFALGGTSSPLTQLQRSFTPSPREQGQKARVEPRSHAGNGDDAAVGTREWYDWFGISTYSDRLSFKSGRSGDTAPRVVPGAHTRDRGDGSVADAYALGEDRGAPQHYYNDMPLSPQKRYM